MQVSSPSPWENNSALFVQRNSLPVWRIVMQVLLWHGVLWYTLCGILWLVYLTLLKGIICLRRLINNLLDLNILLIHEVVIVIRHNSLPAFLHDNFPGNGPKSHGLCHSWLWLLVDINSLHVISHLNRLVSHVEGVRWLRLTHYGVVAVKYWLDFGSNTRLLFWYGYSSWFINVSCGLEFRNVRYLSGILWTLIT